MPLRPLTQELADHYVRSEAWQERLLAAAIFDHARSQPDKLAVSDGHESLTYGELTRRGTRMAEWLRASGCGPDDVIAIQTPNRVALPVLHLACDLGGFIFLPLSDHWRRRELEHLLGTSRARVLIVPPPWKGHNFLAEVEAFREQLPDLSLVAALDGAGGDVDLQAILQDFPEQPPTLEGDPNRPSHVQVTSGTTGLPQLSLWTDNNLWFFMREYRHAVAMGSADVVAAVGPANTGAAGYVFGVLAPLLEGATSFLLERWDPTSALELLADVGATHVSAVPTQVMKMLNVEDVDGYDLTALRVVTTAGAPLPEASAAELEKRFAATSQVVYGATDGGVPAMTRVSDPAEKRHRKVGRLLPLTELRVVDGDLTDVEDGAVGELLWRNPTKTVGYLNAPDRSEAAFHADGWYRSGDLGFLDDDGYLQIVGRQKDLIIRGGQNISPGEVEDAIERHPAVAEAAVIGLADETYGERACAVVILRDGWSLTLDELTAFLREGQMAVFKLPERLETVDELPLSAGGKVDKGALRDLFGATHG